MKKVVRLAWVVAMLATLAAGQNLDKISATVVYLHKPDVSGTGFFVGDGTTMFLITADHVASLMKSDFRATLLAEHDTPFDVSSERTDRRRQRSLGVARQGGRGRRGDTSQGKCHGKDDRSRP